MTDTNSRPRTEQQIQFALDCRVTIGTLTRALEALGLHVYRSFDLRTALLGLPDGSCPHHGTEQCTCQYNDFDTTWARI